MTAHRQRRADRAALPAFAPVGLGSVYGKTMRDSRRAIILVSALLFLIFVGVTGAIASQFSTPESRIELEA
jgi:hypothetical protein